MFHSARERGFPVRVLLISKTTSFLDEAQKIYLLNDIELLKQGWKLKLGSAWDSAYINIPINFIFYFTISYGLIFIFERLKRIYKK